MKWKRWRGSIGRGLLFVAGFCAGGWAMRDVQPRSLFALDRCDHCWAPSEIAGLAGAIAMRHAPGLVPFVVMETPRSIALRLPLLSHGREHYVVVPRRDIRD